MTVIVCNAHRISWHFGAQLEVRSHSPHAAQLHAGSNLPVTCKAADETGDGVLDHEEFIQVNLGMGTMQGMQGMLECGIICLVDGRST